MSFGNFIKQIGHGVKVAVIAVAHTFQKLLGKENLDSFAHASLDLLKTAAGQFILQAVETYKSRTDLTGAQKRDAVLGLAKQQFSGAETSEISLLIELAYAFVKGTLDVAVEGIAAAPAPAEPTS